MPVLAIVGAQDALLDSKETKARLERSALNATVRLVAGAGHVIGGETATVAEFLAKAGSSRLAHPSAERKSPDRRARLGFYAQVIELAGS